jgi:hypothetical protein
MEEVGVDREREGVQERVVGGHFSLLGQPE